MKLIIQNKQGSRFINGLEAHHEPNAMELVNDALMPKIKPMGLKQANFNALGNISHSLKRESRGKHNG